MVRGVGGSELLLVIVVRPEVRLLKPPLGRARCVQPPSSSPPWKGGEMNWGGWVVRGVGGSELPLVIVVRPEVHLLKLPPGRARCVRPPLYVAAALMAQAVGANGVRQAGPLSAR